MIKSVTKSARTDPVLARLLDDVREYASVYILARQRQKGCDGMGEFATMKEEFRDVVVKVMQYAQEREYISRDLAYDIDMIAEEIVRGRDIS